MNKSARKRAGTGAAPSKAGTGAEGLCVETRSRAILAELVHGAVSEAIGLTMASSESTGKRSRTKAATKDSLK